MRAAITALVTTAMLFGACAAGDLIVRADGKRLEGKIVSETPEAIVLRMKYGRVRIARADVARVRRATGAENDALIASWRAERRQRSALVESQREKGLVRHRGQWIPRERRDKILAAEKTAREERRAASPAKTASRQSAPAKRISFATDRFARARSGEFVGLSRQREGAWKGPFFFIQMADPQFGFFTRNKGFAQETALVKRAVEHVNRLRPRFVIVCGDLTNATPGQKQYEPQVAEYKRIFSRIDPLIPLVCVCGNHDVYGHPTRRSLESYRTRFGDDFFGFWAGGVRGLVLNSSLISDPAKVLDEYGRQDAWFKKELLAAKAAKAAHVLVFQHHAWFLYKPDEEDQYYNLPRERRMPLLDLMRDAGVRAVFAGHYHHNAYGKYGNMEMITSNAIGLVAYRRAPGSGKKTRDPSGFRIVKVFRDRISHAYYGLDQVPQSVTLK